MTERVLTPELLLQGYASGIFPMAESRDDPEIFWVDPKMRGVLPLDRFHLSRSLTRDMRRTDWRLRIDTAFEAVVDGCADRIDTWINPDIYRLYLELHQIGHAHSFEIWNGAQLVGGVYGVTLGTAFFGESMFSRATNGSKMALAAAVDHLSRAKFTLFDTQFITPHLASLGAIEITRAAYHRQLAQAMRHDTAFSNVPAATLQEVVQRMTQTS
ncbi:leucyl/phenylalanyl-tRNA--protein transferase [uncultured Tateyamaria sp.]|uniref:leucyl/phenylalanyl-tRNA--protein transferase n=1 Tax=uncultured Tateyamaria sp. TaxID=455651 RepID=UPI00261B1B95|nr:leucyl/phenylalanyl-tRNA--protein transferase [uncultured Tateyamaria sp.]